MLLRLQQIMKDKFARDEVTGRTKAAFLATRPLLYIIIVISSAIATVGYQLRAGGIFACPADGYASDRYLEYCQATGYGDYDHGAFWFGLEPPAGDFVRSAQVLFIGNSRMQFGFSTAATADWFLSKRARYYLLGFGYSEKFLFEQELLRQLRPKAKVYVINIDKFFQSSVSEPAQFVMHDNGALHRYQNKRLWQLIHRPICTAIPLICGHEFAVFRMRQTGMWTGIGGTFNGEPVSDNPVIDHASVQREATLGREFLQRLPIKPECAILTMVPTVETQGAAASALAEDLKLELVAPALDALQTFDGSHLDHASAEHWSRAFFDAAGPRMEQCLSEKPEPES
jgi:hypothetical protein